MQTGVGLILFYIQFTHAYFADCSAKVRIIQRLLQQFLPTVGLRTMPTGKIKNTAYNERKLTKLCLNQGIRKTKEKTTRREFPTTRPAVLLLGICDLQCN